MAKEVSPALWGYEQMRTPRALPCLWDALVKGWDGLVTLSCLAEVHDSEQQEWSERKINYKYESKLQPGDRPH